MPPDESDAESDKKKLKDGNSSTVADGSQEQEAAVDGPEAGVNEESGPSGTEVDAATESAGDFIDGDSTEDSGEGSAVAVENAAEQVGEDKAEQGVSAGSATKTATSASPRAAGKPSPAQLPPALVFLGAAIGAWLGILVNYGIFHVVGNGWPVSVSTFVAVAGGAFGGMAVVQRLGRHAPRAIGLGLGLMVGLSLIAWVLTAGL